MLFLELHTAILLFNITPFIFTSIYNISHTVSYMILLLMNIYRIILNNCSTTMPLFALCSITYISSLIIYAVEDYNTPTENNYLQILSILYFAQCILNLLLLVYEKLYTHNKNKYISFSYIEYKYNKPDIITCCICLIDVEKKQYVHEYRCKHILHKSCSITLQQFYKSCPLCRSSIV